MNAIYSVGIDHAVNKWLTFLWHHLIWSNSVTFSPRYDLDFQRQFFLGYRWLFILLILVELLTITVFMIWFCFVMYGCVGYHIGRLCATGDKPCIRWFIEEHLLIMSVCHRFDIIILIVMIAVVYRFQFMY